MLETVQFNAKNAPFCFFLFFIKNFPGGGGGGMPPDLPSRLGASRRRSSDNTDKMCSGLAPLGVLESFCLFCLCGFFLSFFCNNMNAYHLCTDLEADLISS